MCKDTRRSIIQLSACSCDISVAVTPLPLWELYLTGPLPGILTEESMGGPHGALLLNCVVYSCHCWFVWGRWNFLCQSVEVNSSDYCDVKLIAVISVVIARLWAIKLLLSSSFLVFIASGWVAVSAQVFPNNWSMLYHLLLLLVYVQGSVLCHIIMFLWSFVSSLWAKQQVSLALK